MCVNDPLILMFYYVGAIVGFYVFCLGEKSFSLKLREVIMNKVRVDVLVDNSVFYFLGTIISEI